MADDAEQIEEVSELDPDDARATAKRWRTEIDMYESKRQSFDERAKKILARYRDERVSKESGRKKMNVLWANIETLKPTTYAQIPKAEVKRRFRDQDPVGRVASMILERACDYFLDCKDTFDEMMRHCRDDYLLIGMGVNWQRYVPHFCDGS